MHLQTFTPAEVLLITKGNKADLRELLKGTLLDLLLKKVSKPTPTFNGAKISKPTIIKPTSVFFLIILSALLKKTYCLRIW
jgi:hypothetical protein